MSRLIDADALLKCIPYEDVDSRFAVQNAPTIEPPTTEWIGNHTPFRCKRCGHCSDTRTPYCAYCGKKATNSADELDRFMTALEDLGILTGWKDFKEQEVTDVADP
jgi:hypothetical protein